jgi:hypothetical protein
MMIAQGKGRARGPAVPAADKALETGSFDSLEHILDETVRDGLRARFREAVEKKGFAAGDIEAGREYVKACVLFVHYAEGVYEAAKAAGHGHSSETEDSGHKE